MARWVMVLLFALAVVPPLRAEEVVETFEDGKPRLRYGRDAQGRKHGPCVELTQDGKVVLRCNYREDKLDGLWTAWHISGKPRAKGIYRVGARQGKWEEWKEDGSLWRTSTWRDDRREGSTQVLEGKEVIADQVWEAGRLVRLDGMPAFVRTVEALEALLAPLHPEPIPRQAPHDMEQDRARALRLLRAYRCLCEVPYADVVLDAEGQAFAQDASRICAALGDITHEPPNVGWPQEAYARAARGAKGSNLHQGVHACESVHDYMDDSDPTNVARVGHRCWCLDPNLVKTGFGVTHDRDGKSFTAMWVAGEGRVPQFAPDVVAYPPRGWCPLDMFGPQHAWSLFLGDKKHPDLDPAQLTVELQPLDAEALPKGAPLPLENVLLRADQVPGGGRLVIFRPKHFVLRAGDTFRVTVGGFGPATRKGKPPPRVRYVVGFYASPRPAKR